MTKFWSLFPIASSRGRVLHEILAQAWVFARTQTTPAKDPECSPILHAARCTSIVIVIKVRNELKQYQRLRAVEALQGLVSQQLVFILELGR